MFGTSWVRRATSGSMGVLGGLARYWRRFRWGYFGVLFGCIGVAVSNFWLGDGLRGTVRVSGLSGFGTEILKRVICFFSMEEVWHAHSFLGGAPGLFCVARM